MYRVLKYLLPLLLVFSACKKESLSLNNLEGDWYYDYYKAEYKLDGEDWPQQNRELHTADFYNTGIRIQKSEDGNYSYTEIQDSEAYITDYYSLLIDGNRFLFEYSLRDGLKEWQVVSLSAGKMELKADVYNNKFKYPASTGNYWDHYLEAHATLILLKRAE